MIAPRSSEDHLAIIALDQFCHHDSAVPYPQGLLGAINFPGGLNLVSVRSGHALGDLCAFGEALPVAAFERFPLLIAAAVPHRADQPAILPNFACNEYPFSRCAAHNSRLEPLRCLRLRLVTARAILPNRLARRGIEGRQHHAAVSKP